MQVIGLCQPCVAGLLRDNSQPEAQNPMRPMREGPRGKVLGRSAQHQVSTGQPAPNARKINGGRGHTPGGGIRAKARKKIQRVRVRLPNRT